MKTILKTQSHRILTIVLTLVAGHLLLVGGAAAAAPQQEQTGAGAGEENSLADLPPDARAAITNALEREGILAPEDLKAAQLTASDGENGDIVGTSVAISGDTVVVGAPGDDSQGSAYVFVKPAGGWSDKVESAKLTASDGATGDFFGSSVAIAGDTVVVGGDGDDIGSKVDPGSAYIFVKPAGGWVGSITESAKLTASDGAASDFFGRAVAIANDTVVVGAYGDDVGSKVDQGSAYIFVKPASGWAGSITQSAKLTASDGAGGDSFGSWGRLFVPSTPGVAIADDTVVVGASGDDIGSKVDQGSAYVFIKPAAGWIGSLTQSAKLIVSSGLSDDSLGASVAITGGTVVVGAPGVYVLGRDQGSAYVFLKPANGWKGTITESAKLTATDGGGADFLGSSVAIEGDTIVVGATSFEDGQNTSGSAYLFVKPAGGWAGSLTESAGLPGGSSQSRFGASVAIAGGTAVVGAPDDYFFYTPGSAYVFVDRIEDPAEAGDSFGLATATGDFDGDGYDDLAIGAPFENVGSVVDAGVVNVIYGSSNGLSTAIKPDQLWDQDVANVEDTAETSDQFGFSLTAGDFNGDGYDDLAIGVRFENIGTIVDAGAVNVIYGSAAGLSATTVPDQLWTQNSGNVEGTCETSDYFGSQVAGGDFNGDGYDDLAIGVPLEDVGTAVDAGAVNVIYGSAAGLSATTVPDQFWTQNSANVEGSCETGDQFGVRLAVGNFNGDSQDDLAIGVYAEDVGSVVNAGAVNVIYGSAAGLSATTVPDQFWNQDVTDVEDLGETDDFFGLSLAAGNFNGDPYDDLAIGVPNEDVNSVVDAGAVNVIYGSVGGLSATTVADQFWHQDVADITSTAEASDFFGSFLAVGDFNGSYDDLAIGVPKEDVVTAAGTIVDAGAVNVIYGSAGGLSATTVPDQFWHQNISNVEDTVETGDQFGNKLAVGDFNGSYADLAIGVPYEDVGSIANAGAVNVIHGSAGGLNVTTPPDQFWHQDSGN